MTQTIKKGVKTLLAEASARRVFTPFLMVCVIALCP